MTERYLSAKEFGAIVGLHESKIRQKIRRHEITAVNVATQTPGTTRANPHWRIAESELARFVKRNTQTAAA